MFPFARNSLGITVRWNLVLHYRQEIRGKADEHAIFAMRTSRNYKNEFRAGSYVMWGNLLSGWHRFCLYICAE